MNARILLRPLLLSLPLFITGCGSGGSDSSSSPTSPPVSAQPTPSQIISSAKTRSAQQLKTAATQLADTQYNGSQQTAVINTALAQRAMQWFFESNSSNVSSFAGLPFQELMTTSGAIDTTIRCEYSGTVRVDGQLSSPFKGNLTFTFTNCSEFYSQENMNGTAALTINSVTDTQMDVVAYFNKFRYSYKDTEFVMSGYEILVSDYSPQSGDYVFSQTLYTAVQSGVESVFVNATMTSTSTQFSEVSDIQGDLFFSEDGKVSFYSEGLPFPSAYADTGSVTIVGDKTAIFKFGAPSPYIRYEEDSNGDGVMDVGTFYANADELMYTNASLKTLIAVDLMSLPPRVNAPNYYSQGLAYTTDSITVSPGYYEDPDTALEELSSSYVWYLNGTVIPEQNSNTLPAGIAVFGDELGVAMVVSDGANVVQGYTLNIQIADSPAQVIVSNIPSKVQAGDLISFNATIADPDLPAATGNPASAMIAAPAGATLDQNGVVSWQVPTDLLFPTQKYSFTFGNPDAANQDSETITIDVNASGEQNMPLARKGIESPKRNHSNAIGDFNGDGVNEILSTDSYSSIFLLAHDAGEYKPMWTYPFKAGKGNIVQVLAANLDDDDALEIVVITEQAMSIIYDLQSMAVEFFETDQYINFAQIADINNDGVLSIAYLTSSYSSSSNNIDLTVMSLDETNQILFTTSVDSATQIAFGNVDTDANLELVTNNGLVYDTLTWQNQWFSSNNFGDNSIAVGDFDNNGIDEIAGIDRWGRFAIYSVETRSQLSVIDNLNSCTLTTANINTDPAMELIVGDCQWGEITAYKYANSTLEKVWAISNEDHGSISLTPGDSDNDGELEIHWGSGISSSGADVFVGADINTMTSTAIPKSSTDASPQLDSYHAAGWSMVSDNNENAIFFVPRTGSGYNSSRIVYMKKDGTYTLGNELSNNWSGTGSAVTTDFNKDGFGDIFLPLTQTYDGNFGALQLSNESIHWQTSQSNSSNIGLIRAYDVNGDGYDDALFVDGQNLKIIDVYSQTILANVALDGSINDFSVFKIGDVINVAIAHGERTSLYAFNGSTLSQQSFVEQQCAHLLAINHDIDNAKELICISGDRYFYSNADQSVIVYELQNNTLTESIRNSLNFKVSAVAVDPSTTDSQRIFMVVKEPEANGYYFNGQHSRIISATTSANIIWHSPLMVGNAQQDSLKVRTADDGKLEMLFATQQMMYWIH